MQSESDSHIQILTPRTPRKRRLQLSDPNGSESESDSDIQIVRSPRTRSGKGKEPRFARKHKRRVKGQSQPSSQMSSSDEDVPKPQPKHRKQDRHLTKRCPMAWCTAKVQTWLATHIKKDAPPYYKECKAGDVQAGRGHQETASTSYLPP